MRPARKRSSTLSSSARARINSTTSLITVFKSAAAKSGSRSLLNVSISSTSDEIRRWFRSTMCQPLRDHLLVVLRQPHLDQIAAAANPLQDVLDVVRERGDRLADGGQPLGLHHRRIVVCVFDRQCRLMADRDHQLQMLFGEFIAAAVDGRDWPAVERVDVDHADDVVSPLHRHANRLAHSHPHDAVRARPSGRPAERRW